MFFCMNRTALTNTRLSAWYINETIEPHATRYIRWICVTQSAQLYRYRERNGVKATFKCTPWRFRLIKNTFGDRILRRGMNEREFRTLCHNSHISSLLTTLQGLQIHTKRLVIFLLFHCGWRGKRCLPGRLLVNPVVFLCLALLVFIMQIIL